jgi:hypothetical protein
VRLWDVATGKELPQSADTGHHDPAFDLLFTPDGKTLIANDETAHFWDVTTGRELRRLSRTWVLAVSPDGGALVLRDRAEGPPRLRLADADTLKERRQLPPGRQAKFSPDGRKLAIIGDNELTVSDVETEAPRLRMQPSRAVHAAFAPDGKTLAVSDPPLPLYTRDNRVVPAEVMLYETASGKLSRQTGYWFAFCLDGRAVVGLEEGSLFVRETATGRELWHRAADRRDPLQEGIVGPMAVSPDGRLVATTGEYGQRPSVLELRESYTGGRLARLERQGLAECGLAFSPDSQTVATASTDTTVLLWDVLTVTGRRGPAAKDLGAAWDDLAGPDAERAYRAIGAFAASPDRAVAFLKERLRPAVGPDEKRVRQLLSDLDSDDFDVREKASAELARLGSAVGPALHGALAGKTTPELRRRVTELLTVLEKGPWRLDTEELRCLRAVQALEQIGTREAREVVAAVARGAESSLLTTESRATLRRLEKARP